MTETQESQLLAASDLSISIGEKHLVNGVSLNVRAGECVALVGESGSGKSLTCRALLGTLHRIGASMTGALTIDGRDMSSATEHDWRTLRGKNVGFVPQASMAGLDPVMRVGQQLLETIRLHDGPGTNLKVRALELLAQVEMPDPEKVYRSYPHQLSGGMRQRVMIALALAGRPKVLIADEPTTALDVTVERAILDLLSKLCREEQMGLLLVTHDLGVVRRSAQRVYVMRAGQLVEHGETAEVLARPTHPYTIALLAADPALVQPGQRLIGVAGEDYSND
jgi:ABC-type dipeptide/oligopeptide/nickel transport system ATPase component